MEHSNGKVELQEATALGISSKYTPVEVLVECGVDSSIWHDVFSFLCAVYLLTGFSGKALKSLTILKLLVDLAYWRFLGPGKYPKLGTNALDRRRAVLLREKTKMHSTAHSDQRGMKAAVGSPELTPREAEVLFWISQGKSNHAIGIILGAKTGTICKHVGHILYKLNVENRTSAAVVALKRAAPSKRHLRAHLVKPALLSQLLSQRNSRNCGQALANFSTCSRLSSRDAAVIRSEA